MSVALALIAPAAQAQSADTFPASRFIEQRERFTPEGGVPVELRFLIAREAAGQASRVVEGTHAALSLLSTWFGTLTSPSLTVAGVPWLGSVTRDVRPGLASAPVRWLTPVRDRYTERALIGAVVRQYWAHDSSTALSSFEEGLVGFLSARAITQLLEGSNFTTPRFLGGSVPFPLRAVQTPPVADPRPRVLGFEELEPPSIVSSEVRRTMKALQTLERYVGWPTMLQAIAQMRRASRDRQDAEAFAAALSDVRGTDLRSLVAECLRADAIFDYSLASLQSAPGSSGLIETTVNIARAGSGRFALGHEGGDRDRSMPVLVRFADGSEVRDYVDGAAPASTLVYSAKVAAVSATIDPDVMLLLDVNRENNAIVREAPMVPIGFRLALHWMAWLQNAMLSYTALL